MKFLEIHLEVPSRVRLFVREDSNSWKLFQKWKSTDDDDDFQEFADWITEDVRDEVEFYIEDAKVIN